MKIAFNFIGCGTGNNGGTQSVLRMASALSALDNEVEIWSNSSNKFTWFALPEKVQYRICSLKDAPDVDVLVNTGCSTTVDTYNFKRKKIGVQWLRAHETWVMSEEKLFDLYKLDMPLWVNSEWMQRRIRSKLNKDSLVQYCGIPIEDFNGSIEKPEPFTIGALYSTKPRKRSKDVIEAMKKVEAKLILMSDEPCNINTKNIKIYVRPNLKDKNEMYGQCHIWLAPSENEGLHIPPMEAALCGSCAIVNRVESAGNMDYSIEAESALMFNSGDIDSIVGKINWLRSNPSVRTKFVTNMRNIIKEKIGTVEENANKFINKLKKLI